MIMEVLKAYAVQLCGVLQHIFNLMLTLKRFPVMWKTSCICMTSHCDSASTSSDSNWSAQDLIRDVRVDSLYGGHLCVTLFNVERLVH